MSRVSKRSGCWSKTLFANSAMSYPFKRMPARGCRFRVTGRPGRVGLEVVPSTSPVQRPEPGSYANTPAQAGKFCIRGGDGEAEQKMLVRTIQDVDVPAAAAHTAEIRGELLATARQIN